MPPDIRTGPMTSAAGTPPGRASALPAAGPPGSDPLAALFASLLAHSGGPAPIAGAAALPLKAAPTLGKGEPLTGTLKQAVPLLPTPIQIRPNTPLTAGVTVGPEKTEQKTTEKTMDTSPVPASPDRDKAGANPGGELPLQGAGVNISGLPAIPVLLIMPSLATPAPTATDRVMDLPAGQGQTVAAPSLTTTGVSLMPTVPASMAEATAPSEAAPAAVPVPPAPTVASQQALTAPVAATTLAVMPQVTLAALGAEPTTPGTPKATLAAPSLTGLTVTDGPTAKEGTSAMDGKNAMDGLGTMDGRMATAGGLIMEGLSAKEGSSAKDGKNAMDGLGTRDEHSARDGGTATDGRFIADIKAAMDGKNATDGPVATEGQIATESKPTTDGQDATDGKSTTDGLTAMEGLVATDGKSATDGKMLTAGEPKTGLKSAAMVADTITSTRAQAVQPKAMPMDLQPPVSGTRPERRAESVGSDAPPPLPAQAPVQAGVVSTEAKPLSAADRAEVIRQAADGVGTMPLPAKPGAPEEMTLQLHPKEWGQLQVSVTVTPGSHPNAVQAVTAHIVAQNPQVKAALEGQSGDLRQALREAGLHLDRISVTVQSTEASAQSGTATSGGRHEAHGGSGQGMGGAFGETTPDQKTGTSSGTRMMDGTGMSGTSGNGMPSGGSSGGRQGSQPPPAYAAAYAPTEPEDVVPLGSPRRPVSGQIDMRA